MSAPERMRTTDGAGMRRIGSLPFGAASWAWLACLVIAFTALCWLGVPTFFTGPQQVAPYRPHPKSVLDLAGGEIPLVTSCALFISELRVLRWLVSLGIVSLVALLAVWGSLRLRLAVYLAVLWLDFLLLCVLMLGIFFMLV